MRLIAGQGGVAAASRAEETDKRELVVLQENHKLVELHAQNYPTREVAMQALVQVMFYLSCSVL